MKNSNGAANLRNNSTEIQKFYDLLFSPGEATCYSPSTYGTRLSQSAAPGDIFFSINPMQGSRADVNVTCFRNILLELDNMPLDAQIEHVTSLIPVSTIVYSGGKSYHFILSLDTPATTRLEYDSLVKRIYSLFPECDKSCKNPSRFSRIPGAFREDTGRIQELIKVYGKVNRERLEALLPAAETPNTPVTTPDEHLQFVNSQIRVAANYPDKQIEGMNCGRNAFFFWIGQRMDEANFATDKKKQWVLYTYEKLKNKKDFTLQEALKAARL